MGGGRTSGEAYSEEGRKLQGRRKLFGARLKKKLKKNKIK